MRACQTETVEKYVHELSNHREGQRRWLKPKHLLGKAAKLLIKERAYNISEKWVDKILDLTPENVVGMGLKAQCRLAQNDPRGAEQWVDKKLNLAPKNVVGNLIKGRLLFQRNKSEDAKNCAIKLLEEPSTPAILYFAKLLAIHGVLDRTLYNLLIDDRKNEGL